MRTASENRDILPSRNPSSELPRIRYMRSSQNASHEKFAGVTLHAISKENFIRYPAGGRLRSLQNTNGSELRFRARLSEGRTPRLEVMRV